MAEASLHHPGTPLISNAHEASEDDRFKSNLPKLLFTSFSFLVLFCSYQATQGLVTSLFTSVGNISLATLNSCYALACIFGPTIVDKIGVKKTFIASAIIYCLWVAAVIPALPWLFVVASAFQGAAAGFIWIAHGVYMAGLAQGKSTGRYNSVFLTIFFLSVPAGNTFSGVLFYIQGLQQQPQPPSYYNNNTAPFFTPVVALEAPVAIDIVRPPLFLLLALLGLVVVGAIMFLFIRVPPKPEGVEHPPGILKTLSLLLRVGTEKRSLFFYIYYIWNGVELAFAWSRLPKYLPLNLVPWAFVAYGTGLFIGSLSLVPYLVLLLIITNLIESSIWLIFFCSFCFGAIETLFNTYIQSSIMKFYEGERVATAFSIWRVVSGIFVALGYVLLQFIDTIPMMGLSEGLMVLGILLIITHEYLASREKPNKLESNHQSDHPVV